MKIFFALSLLSQAALANQTFTPPSYQNYRFLGNTADELRYTSAGYNKPDAGQLKAAAQKVLAERAHGTCKFLGLTSAKFATTNKVVAGTPVIVMDAQGFALTEVTDEIVWPFGSTVLATTFSSIDCIK